MISSPNGPCGITNANSPLQVLDPLTNAPPIVQVATTALSEAQTVQKPDVLNFSFITEVKKLDPTTKEWKKIEIFLSNGREQISETIHHFFIWVKTDSEFPKGEIKLKEKEDERQIKVIEVDWMKTNNQKTIKGLGRALHEFAIRFSFFKGCEGRVRLYSDDDACGFHFKCGYRWANGFKHHFDVTLCHFNQQVVIEYCNLCEQYRTAKASGLPFDELEKGIQKHRYFKTTVETAKKELKRDPKDISEVLDYGLYFFWDTNVLLDKFYHHPEQNLKSRYCNPKDKIFYIQGQMFLSEEERIKWKTIIEPPTKREP